MKKIAIAVLLSAFVAAPAVAAGGYVGVNAGSASIDVSGTSSTTSFGVLGGYNFNEYFGAEVAYTNFGSKDYANGSIKSSAFGVSGVGSFPFNEQFSVFAKVGFASTTTDFTVASGPFAGSASFSKSDVTYGIGGQFNVNKQFGIRLGYDVYKLGDSSGTVDQKNTSIGAVFNF